MSRPDTGERRAHARREPGRPPGAAGLLLLALPGGKSLNSLSLALPSFFTFFSGLSEISSCAMPRQSRPSPFASKMSTTSVPTVYSLSVVVAVPVPPKPR